jgi:hypothetical protein
MLYSKVDETVTLMMTYDDFQRLELFLVFVARYSLEHGNTDQWYNVMFFIDAMHTGDPAYEPTVLTRYTDNQEGVA